MPKSIVAKEHILENLLKGIFPELAKREGGEPRMHALGRHLLIELHGCDPTMLKKVEVVKDILVAAARACGATIVDTAFHEFNPFGVSGVVVIAESHLSIHTWPEYRYAAVDIFTCGDTLKPEEAVDYVAARFRCRTLLIMKVPRGVFPKTPTKRQPSPANGKQKKGFEAAFPLNQPSPAKSTTPSR